jgi:hypothetical protein
MCGHQPDRSVYPLCKRSFVKAKRSGAAFGLLAAGALLLSACGSDNNTSAGSGSGSGESGSESASDWFLGAGQRDDSLHQRL